MSSPAAFLLSRNSSDTSSEELFIQKLCRLLENEASPISLPWQWKQPVWRMPSGSHTYPYVCFCSDELATV